MFDLQKRRQSLIDPEGSLELMLPVTPKSYSWENGITINSANVEGLGTLHLPGYKMLDTRQIDCMFPAHDYPFNEPGILLNPFEYVYQIEKWCQGGKVLQYIVSGTPLNACVIIEKLRYMEQDGTHDVYATITLRQYQSPGRLEAAQQQAPRQAGTAPVTASDYVVVSGDTLWAICRKHYGDATLCYALASYNSIKNANLIAPGQCLKMPVAAVLKGGAP